MGDTHRSLVSSRPVLSYFGMPALQSVSPPTHFRLTSAFVSRWPVHIDLPYQQPPEGKTVGLDVPRLQGEVGGAAVEGQGEVCVEMAWEESRSVCIWGGESAGVHFGRIVGGVMGNRRMKIYLVICYRESKN